MHLIFLNFPAATLVWVSWGVGRFQAAQDCNIPVEDERTFPSTVSVEVQPVGPLCWIIPSTYIKRIGRDAGRDDKDLAAD